MTGRYLLLAGCLAGCHFNPGSLGSAGDGGATDDVLGDTGVDTPDTPPDASVCYGSALAMPCFVSAPTGAVTIDADVDTDSSSLCDGDARNASWCVIAGTSIGVTTTVHVTGTLPLVLVATTTIDVSGALDASSVRADNQIGAGAKAMGCSPGTLPSDDNAGGAGGSFGGQGGDGGGTGHGTAGATLTPTTLRGGCPGQHGGGGAGVGGEGGSGGGALYLFADTSITVGGTIDASGAGGQAGQSAQAGGGGGGTGGMIVLDSPSITVTGQVYANGGGGGEGGRQGGTAAEDGFESTGYDVAGLGGDISSTGGDGGTGSIGATLGGTDGTAGNNGGSGIPGGSGGGGGGAGIIRRLRDSAISGTQISPPAT